VTVTVELAATVDDAVERVKCGSSSAGFTSSVGWRLQGDQFASSCPSVDCSRWQSASSASTIHLLLQQRPEVSI